MAGRRAIPSGPQNQKRGLVTDQLVHITQCASERWLGNIRAGDPRSPYLGKVM